MNNVIEIGKVPWSREEILSSLSEFEQLYERRPIRNNNGGMKSPHMFAVWYIARRLAPQTIIESGIWKGQSTWLLEQACPSARIISIDLNLARREYISDRVRYSSSDFAEQDWTDIDPLKTLVFFDDHQNAYTRLQQCYWFGFQHVIFEDNYPPEKGDCYSLKKAFAHAGFQSASGRQAGKEQSILDRAIHKAAQLLTRKGVMPQYSRVQIQPNQQDARFLAERLQTYYEFPPIFQSRLTRWGDAWSQETYPTAAPLLQLSDAGSHPVLADEAVFYTWICYVALKTSA